MNYIKYSFFILFLCWSNSMFSQNCTVNAGGNVTICGTSHTLAGSAGGSTSGTPTWTILSKPSGAPDPVISDINSYTPNVTGLDYPGTYVFEISQPCVTGTVTSQVTITAPGSVATHTAGPVITNVSAVTGTVTLNGVIPPGYTGQWTAINIYNQQRFSQTNSQNATFSNPTSATTTFSLIKKADHDVDPAYRVRLTITSTVNPNCSYTDEAIVRFVPNPAIVLSSPFSMCISPTNPALGYYLPFTANSPVFATRQSNVAGNPAYGTTVTLNVVSQPAGGNMTYRDISDDRLFFDGTDVPGSYVFTITVSNTLGESYTTPNLTYTNNGYQPRRVSFLTSTRPEQMALYSWTGSAGEVHCASMVGTTTPITFLFTIDPSDPATVTSTITNVGVAPPGGVPTLSLSGAGTHNRSVTVTPPAGGWRAGTYQIQLVTRNGSGAGSCSVPQHYFIHISDGNREDIQVDDMTVCYPGSGSVTATIPLPAVWQGVVNSSYFQAFNGIYKLETISRPPGSAVPVFESIDHRTFLHTSTTISNLDKEGEYVFRITAVPRAGGIAPFIEQEFACSGASITDTFSVFVSTQVNANAGSNQDISGRSQTHLNGNNPGGTSSGLWTLVSKPAGAPDPVIIDPTLYNSQITGLTSAGIYKLKWTITTGNCTSEDEVEITADGTFCEGPDTDGDGIPDMCDLDSDNDGILDTDECYGEQLINGSFTGNANGWTLGGNWNYSGGEVRNTYDYANNEVLSQTISTPLSNQNYTLSFRLGSTDYNNTNSGWTASLEIKLGGITYAVFNNATGRDNNVTLTLSNGATSDFAPYSSTNSRINTDVVINIPFDAASSTDNQLQFIHSATGDDWYLDNISLMGGCDTDGDGIPDYLDLDSDNDGCPDAIEGDENVDPSHLNPDGSIDIANNGGVDADGVPVAVGGGQGVGSSQDAVVNACIELCETPHILEFASGDGNPIGQGPVLNTNIRFRENTDNPAGNTFETFSPAVNINFELVNQVYSLPSIGTGYPVNIGYQNNAGGGPMDIFVPLNTLGAPSASWFTSFDSNVGEGIAPSVNRGIVLNTTSTPLRTANAVTSGVAHPMADLVVTFSKPVDYPVIHIAGMGSRTSTLGFSQEYDLIASNVPTSLTRLSGSNVFTVSGNNIRNSAATGQMDATGTNNSGSGSVRINGKGITTLTFRVSMRGDGKTSSPAGWSNSTTLPVDGEGASISFSLGVCEDQVCTKPGVGGTPDGFTKVGVSTMKSQVNGWPENISNGFIALDSKEKGFVITRVPHVGGTNGSPDIFTDSIADPKEGMLVYDIQDECVKLFNGEKWNCINKSCNTTDFTLNCSDVVTAGDTHGPDVSFTISIPYANGDGSPYAEQIMNSMGVTGLTAILSSGTLENGDGTLIISVSGTVDNVGAAQFEFEINGHSCILIASITQSAGDT